MLLVNVLYFFSGKGPLILKFCYHSTKICGSISDFSENIQLGHFKFNVFEIAVFVSLLASTCSGHAGAIT